MCELTTALMIGSTLYGAYSSYQQGQAQAKATQITADNNQKLANYNAEVLDNNAKLKDAAADDAVNRGAESAANIKLNAKKSNATARAKMAGAGLIVDTGTNLDLLGENTEIGTTNALITANNAEREAYGYKMEETDLMAQATNQRLSGAFGVANASYTASAQKQAGLLNAGTTLVTGAANYGKYYDDKFATKKKA